MTYLAYVPSISVRQSTIIGISMVTYLDDCSISVVLNTAGLDCSSNLTGPRTGVHCTFQWDLSHTTFIWHCSLQH